MKAMEKSCKNVNELFFKQFEWFCKLLFLLLLNSQYLRVGFAQGHFDRKSLVALVSPRALLYSHLVWCTSPAGARDTCFPDRTCSHPKWAEQRWPEWPAPAAGSPPAAWRTSDVGLSAAQMGKEAASPVSAEPAWLFLLYTAGRGKHRGKSQCWKTSCLYVSLYLVK